MKIVLLIGNESKENIKNAIEYFIAYGYNDMILFVSEPNEYFTTEEKFYYSSNGVKITLIKSLCNESTSQRLLFIKGSLEKRFLLVYSSKIINTDIDIPLSAHKEEEKIATLLVYEEKMIACILENEIFDYTSEQRSFEKEILERVGQDLELNQIIV